MREIIKLKKIIPILFSLLLIFTGCENIEFNHSFRQQLDEDLSVYYTFYETYDYTGNSTKLKFYTGQSIYPSDFPVYTHDEELLVGWQYLGNQIPKNVKLDSKEYISSITVGLKEESFFCIWKTKRYVTFVTNNDLVVATAVVAEGDKVAAPQIQNKHGRFRFAGWYIDEELTERYDFSTPVNEDISLYAKWIEFNTIKYYKNDGSNECHVEEVDVGESYWVRDYMFNLRNNYGFVGWATSADGNAEIYPDKNYRDLQTDLNLYAVWTTDLITITYIDTTSNFASETVTFGKGAHVRIGQIFSYNKSWYDFLYSKWTVIGKELKGFSTLSDDDVENLPYDVWGNHSVPEYDDEGNYQSSTWTQWTEMTSDATFYAYWGDRTYDVYFYYYDEDGVSHWFDSQEVLWNQKAVRPENVPHLAGYRFVNWYKRIWDSQLQESVLEDTPFDFDTVFNEETINNEWGIDLYAKFEPADTGIITASVTFSENPESDISLPDPIYSYDNSTIQFTAPSGYISYTWYLDGVELTAEHSSSLTVNLSALTYGVHDLWLVVYDGENYYSWGGQLAN